MRFVIIAGEASGDLHGSNLIRAIKTLQPDAEFRFFGGERMASLADGLVKDYRDMAFMGFFEVLTHLNSIRKNLQTAREMILDFKPEAVILIDYPGFNLRIAAFAKEQDIPVFYYISPKVWAWKQSRILKIRQTVDRMFAILPFEVAFYRQHGMEVSYSGNPVLDEIDRYLKNTPEKEAIRSEFNLGEKPLILLAPGSRKQELKYNLSHMVALTERFPGYRFVIAGAPGLTPEDYAPYLNDKDIPVIPGRFYDLLLLAEAAIVTSGTATLETALMNVPQVAVYKGNTLSYAVAKRLVRVKYISLVNLIADAPVIRELIQNEVRPEIIAAETARILPGGEKRGQMLEGYLKVRDILGKPGVSERVAREMIERLEK
ncbi:MAG: lipid-A-disaccharide synthase [Chlorobi bacterium]|nr:lipid-A-disaccharide synthase [Chlorobiota bacterium]